MTAEAASILLATLGLSIAAVLALLLSLSRPGIESGHRKKIRLTSGVTLGLQLLHFTEEYLHQFHVRLPELLGLAVWPETFFLTFNLVWLTIWAAAITSLETFPKAAAFPLWFLAIASAANGLAHPLMAIAVDGYFPGLWSSPLVGILGLLLLRQLSLATNPNPGRISGRQRK